MQQGSDAEFSWLQKAYVQDVRPQVLGTLDATSYAPDVAPTGTVVIGIEGANLGTAAHRAAAAVEQAGGRPVVIDAVALRSMHDRLAPGGQSDVASDVAMWAGQLVQDALRRRLDPVVAMTTASPAQIDGIVNSFHRNGSGIVAIAVHADPAAAMRSAGVRALSGQPGDQVGTNMQARSQVALNGVVDRLDRDSRVQHIRIVDEHHRTIFRADPSRHANASPQAVKYLDSRAVGRAGAHPFARRPERETGRGR